MKIAILAFVSTLALGGAAHADDFEGFYLGVFWSKSTASFDINSTGNAANPLSNLSSAFDSFAGYNEGIRGGYNWRNGNLVVSVAADAVVSGANRRIGPIPRVAGRGQGAQNQSATSEVRNLSDVRARVGYDIDRTLFYAFGGAASGNVRVVARNASPVEEEVINNNHSGTVFGGGFERQLTDRLSFFIEYAQYNLGREEYNFPSTSSFGDNSIDLTTRNARLGAVLNFR